jgi:hypothetical protein
MRKWHYFSFLADKLRSGHKIIYSAQEQPVFTKVREEVAQNTGIPLNQAHYGVPKDDITYSDYENLFHMNKFVLLNFIQVGKLIWKL